MARHVNRPTHIRKATHYELELECAFRTSGGKCGYKPTHGQLVCLVRPDEPYLYWWDPDGEELQRPSARELGTDVTYNG